jgi:hypothetical protein
MATPHQRHRKSDNGVRENTAESVRRAEKPTLDKRDVIALIWATYRATLPYLIIFMVAFLFVTWLVTDVFLR